jgi:hypothetical protein
MKKINKTAIALSVMAALGTTAVEASHFRGGAIVPTIDANGLMTVTSTTFWRKGVSDYLDLNTSVGTVLGTSVLDNSDARFDVRTSVYTKQLTGSGTYTMSMSSCCRVGGIKNWQGIGSSSVAWQLDSTIVWDGVNAAAPILFDFNAINPEVVRGTAYNDSLGAISGSGLALSYNNTLNGIPVQPPGLVVNPATGALFIDAASTNQYTDNGSNLGADYAFSGQVLASDGSMIEFDWLFDGVGVGSANLAPTVDDQVINALVGSTVSTTVTGTDPDGNPLNWSLLSFFGPAGALSPIFDPLTQLLTWDTTGLSVGDTLIANVRASDGSLNDTGTIKINIVAPTQGVPEPGTLLLMGVGLPGLGASLRKKKQS